MFQKTAIIIAAIVVFVAGGIFPSLTFGGESFRMIAHEEGPNGTADEPAASGQVNEDKNVGNKYCPVTGVKINEETKVTYEYKGKIYNFCCSSCIDEFKKDPEKFIERMKDLESGKDGPAQEDQH
jgi:YHS domain-containing protein